MHQLSIIMKRCRSTKEWAEGVRHKTSAIVYSPHKSRPSVCVSLCVCLWQRLRQTTNSFPAPLWPQKHAHMYTRTHTYTHVHTRTDTHKARGGKSSFRDGERRLSASVTHLPEAAPYKVLEGNSIKLDALVSVDSLMLLLLLMMMMMLSNSIFVSRIEADFVWLISDIYTFEFMSDWVCGRVFRAALKGSHDKCLRPKSWFNFTMQF